MSFQVKNLTANAVAVGKLTLPANETRTVDFVDAAIVAGVNGGYLSVTGQTATTLAGSNIALVDSTTGVASVTNTLVDVTVAPTQATVNANFATLAALINQLSVQVNNSNALVAALNARINE